MERPRMTHVFIFLIVILNSVLVNTEVCYPRLGCFNIQPPFNNTGIYPEEPGFINTVFKLYTRSNPTQPHDLTPSNLTFFNPRIPTKIVIHGFLQDWNVDWLNRTAAAFLLKYNVNVIIVGWGRGSGFPYNQAAANTRVVGAEVGYMVNSLINRTATSPRKIHLIGHSLGAHVASYAGDKIPGLARITGLDPARPSFEGTDAVVRLDKGDAKLVDVIHTDGSSYNTFSGYGIYSQVGHIDFYPNGGYHQPGCGGETYRDVMSNVFTRGFNNAENSLGCSHDRACDLFIESIKEECPFKGYPCPSMSDYETGQCLSCGNRLCPSMGLHADRYKSFGKFYLQTSESSPYCGYQYYIELKLSHDSDTDSGTIQIKLVGSQGETEPIILNSETAPPTYELRKLFCSGSDIGMIRSASLTFRSSGFLSWFTRPHISVKRVITHSLKRDQRIFFCQRKWIKGGETIDLQSGSTHPC